jgi:hypothetical protein
MRNLPNKAGILDTLSPLRSYRDEITHEKIHRHLTDINDTITEEDIRNIQIITGPVTTVLERDIPVNGYAYELSQAS